MLLSHTCEGLLSVQNDIRHVISLNFHNNIKLIRAGLHAFILEDLFNKHLGGHQPSATGISLWSLLSTTQL